MPIYAYRCSECHFSQDILQKISDPELNVCPACGAAQFKKQVTAAGFQLKGSGWYATDFRNPSNAAPAKSDSSGAETKTETAPATPDTPTTNATTSAASA